VRKYNPGDVVLVKGKILSATENEDGKITYSFVPESGKAYNIVSVNETDIRLSLKYLEVKPQ